MLQHFGKEIIAKELEVSEDHEDVHRLYLAIYKSFVEVWSCTDNQPLNVYCRAFDTLNDYVESWVRSLLLNFHFCLFCHFCQLFFWRESKVGWNLGKCLPCGCALLCSVYNYTLKSPDLFGRLHHSVFFWPKKCWRARYHHWVLEYAYCVNVLVI